MTSTEATGAAAPTPHSRLPTPPPVRAAELVTGSAFDGLRALGGLGFETHLVPHVHCSYVLGVVEAGAVRITANGCSAIATAGSVVLLAPYTVHTESPVAPGGWSFRYIYPTEQAVRAALGALPIDDRSPALPFRQPVVHDDTLAHAVRYLHDLLRSGAPAARLEAALRAMLMACRSHAGDPLAAARRALTSRRGQLEELRQWIATRPPRNLRVADLASAAGVSDFQLIRAFKAAFGLPPYAYFEQVRIAHAHDLIGRGMRLADVAYELGYSDQSHLTRQFRRASFTTPGAFARLARRRSDPATRLKALAASTTDP